MVEHRRLGILVGGGPAPGINGVISAATIEARNNGMDVLGFWEGFKHLMAGRTDQYRPLDVDTVSRIHFQGGSVLKTARANPTKKPEDMQRVVTALRELNVKYLITIGGDDTAFSSNKLAAASQGFFQVVHVPKTIDNDLPLPPGVPTFGFETARHFGVQIVQNLMADAQTAPRWYIVVAMGRKAGHLALGIGKAAAAPLTVIPEEWHGRPVTFKEVCDVVEGAIIKRKSLGRDHGVAILAEGLAEFMTDEDREKVFGNDEDITRDDHGHLKLEDIEFGRSVRIELRRRFKARGLSVTMVSKNLGYELRCADPIPFDCEYTRNLGFGAVQYLLHGGSGAIVTFQGATMVPMPVDSLIDSRTGRPQVRYVDTNHESYQVARQYMIRLEKRDFEEKDRLERLAAAGNMTVEQFRATFEYLVHPPT
jgi:6-phosphofructokinase 1